MDMLFLKMNIITSHYNEDLTWLNLISKDHKVFIYSKSNKNYNYMPLNKGNEASAYLKYIIDNYDNLGDKNLFIHGHRMAYHQSCDMDFIINNLKWDLDSYFSINRRDWYFDEGVNNTHHADNYNCMKSNWGNIFGNNLAFPESFHHYSCAQFQVDKELILSNSKQFYEHLFNWLMNTNMPNYWNARIFEHTWHYIFTKNPIEKKRNNFLI